MERPTIAVIGSGNVATHLAEGLDGLIDVVQVLSKNINHAASLAEKLRNAEAIDNPKELRTDADFYLISVNDDSISEVVKAMPKVKGMVMHTSGSMPLETISGVSDEIGVLYPLQTFSKDVHVDLSKVPFFLEASNTDAFKKEERLARLLSENIYFADSKQRTTLHIAAVFGCNFFNHLLTVAEDVLHSEGYGIEVLRPLLEVTLDKAMRIGPHNAQTGPAARRDFGVINKHLAYLDEGKAEIYRILSESIMNNMKP